MEDLVRSMYKCPVQVKLVEYGMEPFALLAHLENSYILHHGSRSEFLGRQKPKVAAQPSLYQIRTDERFETTRTMQVDFDSPLISRDCFFFFDQALENHLLWRGENFDLSLLELAVEAVIKITQCTLFRADSVSESLHSNVIKEANEEEEEEDIPTTLPENVQFASGLDSPALVTFYGNLDSNIPFLSIPDSMPKLFTCSCASGYFRVERLAHYSQSHLQPDTCVLIDPGSDQSLFVWMGRDASDVVKKLGMHWSFDAFLLKHIRKLHMEAAYVKNTVGPILTEALTSLVMHVPNPGANPSSYDTTLDPISYIGQYLVDYAASEKKNAEIRQKIEAIESVEKSWRESQARQKVARDLLGDGLAARLSIRRSQIEASDVPLPVTVEEPLATVVDQQESVPVPEPPKTENDAPVEVAPTLDD
ncbi:hypothetical protein HDU91_004518 [Kappamyces sp. JEL0680]|nr:hypothetical protein HDU91_004518 [Kappamyces sp. JEL0680]